MRKLVWGLPLVAVVVAARPAAAQTAAATVLEESIAPGLNYEKAEFKLWLPTDVGTVTAIAVLVPRR